MPNPTSRAASQPALTRLPRGTLSQAVIIEAALAVSERKGLGALSFQALGAELGAHPTAIYRHFRDKDELVLAVVDGLYAEMLAELAPSSEDWAADLRTLATTMHDVFVRTWRWHRSRPRAPPAASTSSNSLSRPSPASGGPA